MSLIQAAASKRRQIVERQKQVQKRQHGVPESLADIVEAKDLQTMLRQAETLHEHTVDQTFIVKNDKPGYNGKHRAYKYVHMMWTCVTALRALQEIMQKPLSATQKARRTVQYADIMDVVKYVWRRPTYKKLVDNYYKYGHVGGADLKVTDEAGTQKSKTGRPKSKAKGRVEAKGKAAKASRR